MTTNPIPEGNLLASLHPDLVNNSDEWPEFELKDVKVFTPNDPSNLTSLLEAAAHYPLTLTGHLEPLAKDQAHLYTQTTTRRAPLIEIKDVRLFSYGQFEDGNIGLWAGGLAGWYALKPSRAYKSIWSSMVESVDAFYWVVDSYREKRRKGNKKNGQILPDFTAEELFDKYADEVLEDAKGGKEAAQVIYEQRHFLLSSMLAGKEGIAWARNPLYEHLSTRFPDDHALVKSRLTGQALPARNDRQKSASVEGGILKRKRGKPAKGSSADVTSRENSMVDAAETTSQREASQQHPAKSMASRRTRRGQRESPSTGTPGIEAKTPRVNLDSDDEQMHRSMKGRSALRPKATKAGKGASKGGKAPVQDFDDDNDSDDDQLGSPTAIAKKNQSHTFANRNAKQKTSSKHDVDEGIDIPSSPASGEIPSTPSESGLRGGDNDNSDEEDEDEPPGTDLALRLKHAPDPIQEDTWICALDGCSHKVYQASQPDSQLLIREHYALHAYDDDERVQLVKKLQHPSLPVGHLMERVRSQARSDGFPGSRGVALEGAAAHSRYRPLPQARY
ncbi:hypothetical protein Q7P36_001804 [Cladosporium allicinum]